ELAGIAASVLKNDGAVADCITRANEPWPKLVSADVLFGASLGAVASDPLLHCLLTLAPVADLRVERFLTAMRRALLETATEATEAANVEDDVLALSSALARQCFLNGYVFRHGDDEIARARSLRDKIAAALASSQPIPVLRIVAAAAYAPLHTLPEAPTLLARTWPEALREVLDQQVREPREEKALRQSITRLTVIEDAPPRPDTLDTETARTRWTTAGHGCR